MPLTIINPIEYPNWNDLLLTNKDASFFHTSNWAKVLSESYKYKPVYFTSIDNEKLLELIPFMEVNSFLTGKRGVSLPFSDFCRPLVSDKKDFKNLFKGIVQYAKNEKWKYLEIRSDKDIFSDEAIVAASYFIHNLDIEPDKNKLMSCFRSSTRRNIKKSIKEGVIVKLDYSAESLKAFYRLNCLTRKRHGIPTQPYYFFKKIYDHIISKKKGFIVTACYKDKYIAGAIYFNLGTKCIYKYGASDINYQKLRANNLVMWEAIKWSAQNGIKKFSFGRTDLEHKGLLQFKKGWGADVAKLEYYKYDVKRTFFIEDNLNSKYSYLVRRIPLPLLKCIGSLLYRHVA